MHEAMPSVRAFALPENMTSITLENEAYRRVHTTHAGLVQLVLMSIPPRENIPMETHPTTLQFIRIEKGYGRVIRDGQEDTLPEDGFVFILPGTEHEVINDSASEPLKLYSLYYPPEHPVGLVQLFKPPSPYYYPNLNIPRAVTKKNDFSTSPPQDILFF